MKMNYFLVWVMTLAICETSFAGGKDKLQAKEAFKQGVEYFRNDRNEEAVEMFYLANELNPSWRILYNIGQCNAALKKYGLALDAFEEYLSTGGDEVSAKRRQQVLEELGRLRQMVGSIEFRGPDGALVFIDGIKRGTIPLPGKIRIGSGAEHDVRIVLDGEEVLSRKVRLGGHETTVIEVVQSSKEPDSPEPGIEDAPQADVDTEVDTFSKKKVAGWILLGTGAVVLAGGAVTGGIALNKNKTIQNNCPNGECLPEYHDTVDSRDALATTTTVLIGIGAVSATVGVLLLTVFRDEESDDGVAISFLPSVGMNRAGADFAWRF